MQPAGHALKPEKGALGKIFSAVQKFALKNVLGFDPYTMVWPHSKRWRAGGIRRGVIISLVAP